MREGTKLRERFPSRTHNDCSGRARRMTAGYVPFAIHALPRSDQIRSDRHEIALRSRSHRDLPCCRKGLWLRSSQCPANARPIPTPNSHADARPIPTPIAREHVRVRVFSVWVRGCVGAWVRARVRVCACFLCACAHTHTHKKVASILTSVHAYICTQQIKKHRAVATPLLHVTFR